MRISPRYIIPLVVFLIVRVIVWGFEVRHRRDVQQVFESAQRNGWPVILLDNDNRFIDYAFRIFTLDSGPSGVWMGPGLQSYGRWAFIHDGSIINLSPSSEGKWVFLNIEPPHFSPGILRAHTVFDRTLFVPPYGLLEVDYIAGCLGPGVSWEEERFKTNLYGVDLNHLQYWLDDRYLIINDLLTGDIKGFDVTELAGWNDTEFEGYSQRCVFSHDCSLVGIVRSVAGSDPGSPPADELWICSLEPFSVRRIMRLTNRFVQGLGWDGRIIRVGAGLPPFDIIDTETGSVLHVTDRVELGRRWVAELSRPGPLERRDLSHGLSWFTLYDADDEFSEHVLYFTEQERDVLVSIYEPESRLERTTGGID